MSDVIAAVSTGNQLSAIGIIRMSGDNCAQTADKVISLHSGGRISDAPNRKLLLGALHDRQGRTIDTCMVVYTRGPNSYTGEDTVEFHCHGSPAVLAAGLDALYAAGARPAQRGEFTKRAFLNGRMDLTQAEAVIDLIEAETADAAANAAGQVGGTLQKRLSPIYDTLTDICSHFHAVLDYPDEDIDDFGLDQYESVLSGSAQALESLLQTYAQGQVLRTGVRAAIVGKPNVGKSSLLNALAGYERAIVTQIAGTTRDTVEESVIVGKTKLRLTDTAGIRETDDTVEAIGVSRAKAAVENADIVFFLCDGSLPTDENDRKVMDICRQAKNVIGLINKTDLGCVIDRSALPFETVIPISAVTGSGLDLLAEAVDTLFAGNAPYDGSILTNARQYDALRRAHSAMCRAMDALRAGITPDAVLTDVEIAMSAMGEITGATVREDITARIFERFCVGK